MAWLDDLLAMTDESETPKSFIRWAGLSAIAAVAKNNVFLDKHYYKLYPNIYVMLIAKSGMRKSFAVFVAKELVKAVGNTRVISGRNSIQAIIKELSSAITSDNGGPPNTDASALIASGEFANLLVEDPQALTILTDLYDGHYNPSWTNTLKGSGVEKLKNISLTLLGASNQTHFKDRVSGIDITGGFIARTLIVLETKKNRINPLTEEPKISFNIAPLVERLKEISTLKGSFIWDPFGKKVFEDWYAQFSALENSDETGTMERMHDHVLKIAMLYSLSEKNELILMANNVNRAIKTCQEFTANVKNVTAGSGIGTNSAQMAKFVQTLIQADGYKVERAKMLQKNWGHFDVYTMNVIVETLMTSRVIEAEQSGNKTYYVLTDESVANYFKAKEEN